MQFTKKAASIVLGLGAVAGMASSLALAVHAQTDTSAVQPAPVADVQPAASSVTTPAVAQGTKDTDIETNDDKGNVDTQKDGEQNDATEATEVHHFNTDPAHEAKEKAVGRSEEK